MSYYILRLKTDKSRVDRIESRSLEEAKTFYMRRKGLEEKIFNKLYEVEIDE